MPHFVKIGQVIYTDTKCGHLLDLPFFPLRKESGQIQGVRWGTESVSFVVVLGAGVVTRCADGCKLPVR